MPKTGCGRPSRPAKDRLIEKTEHDPKTGCWNFTGFVRKDGYGGFTIAPPKVEMAHRAAYKLFRGDVAPHLDVHHLCDNRRCVNPEHLEACEKKQHYADLSPNNRAYQRKRATHCLHGHAFTPENTIWRGHLRQCVTCHRAWYHRRAERVGRETYLAKRRERYLLKADALNPHRKRRKGPRPH